MTAFSVARLVPWSLVGRIATAFAELALVATVLSAAVIVGHELREWRAWYWDPATTHPWAPTTVPTEAVSAVARPGMPAAVPTPNVATAAARPATPTPPCRPSTGSEQLAFMKPVPSGADCVWLVQKGDGTHLVVATSGSAPSDVGVVATPRAGADVRVYSPNSWDAPVIVAVGHNGAGAVDVLVFTWQGRQVAPLLRTTGTRIDVAADPAGWPRVSVTGSGGAKAYAWDGRAFSVR